MRRAKGRVTGKDVIWVVGDARAARPERRMGRRVKPSIVTVEVCVERATSGMVFWRMRMLLKTNRTKM